MYKPVTIPINAFRFCRYTQAILLWIALILHLKWLVVISFLIFALSAILKIKNAPMIFLYSNTLNRIFKSKDIILDEKAMQFVHTIAAGFALIVIISLYLINDQIGWIVLFLFCILKTLSAVGFCPAGKLYGCAMAGGGSCCSFLKKKHA